MATRIPMLKSSNHLETKMLPLLVVSCWKIYLAAPKAFGIQFSSFQKERKKFIQTQEKKKKIQKVQ